jgi:hypothetical protein
MAYHRPIEELHDCNRITCRDCPTVKIACRLLRPCLYGTLYTSTLGILPRHFEHLSRARACCSSTPELAASFTHS